MITTVSRDRKISTKEFSFLLVPSECYVTAYEYSSPNTSKSNAPNTIDVLLPNGLIACIERDQHQTLADLRQILRKQHAVTWPFHFLSITHTFTNDTGDALLDEQQPLDTLGLVYPFVRVSAKGELPTPLCKWLTSVDQPDIESLIQFIEQLVEWRDTTIPQELLHAPPTISQTILSNIDPFLVHLERPDKSYTCTPTTTCQELIERILNDQNKSSIDYNNASTQTMLKFSHRNEFLLPSEPYPILQYSYIQECLQKNIQINLQLTYIELPKRSKRIGQIERITEPEIFPLMNKRPSPLTSPKTNTSKQSLLPLQPASSFFKFTIRLRPSSNAKQALFHLHSGIYYGRRCLFSFEQVSWNNTFTEEITQITNLPIANILPGTLLCFALTSKQSDTYFLNISLFRSNGLLLNGSHEYVFNSVNSSQNLPNTKHIFPDSFIGSTSHESTGDSYEIKLKFDAQQYRFYSNEEIFEKLLAIEVPTPTVVSTAKQQQHQEMNDDVANGEALNYLLGMLNEEVGRESFASPKTILPILDSIYGTRTSMAFGSFTSSNRCSSLCSPFKSRRNSSFDISWC